ncbi:hypothetical protein DFJ74DRAFT_756687 [Hyaloraphidium curvatum]|nr:hypothetical protein DFJ74DRAFT_756687 [Hyaloraphidium curvatum]
MDSAMQAQYSALRAYLPKDLMSAASTSPQRQSAREKLTRLTKQQFQELSTDVFDEMKRRQLDAAEVPFLPVRDDFHPKRNQARQKLATLPASRFRDLASDVLFEIERRFPWVSRDAALGGMSAGVSAGLSAGGYGYGSQGAGGSMLGADYGANRSLLGDGTGALYRQDQNLSAVSPLANGKDQLDFASLDNLMAGLDGGRPSQAIGSPSGYSAPSAAVSAAVGASGGRTNEVARVRQEYELRIQRVTEDVGKMRADYERRIQDYELKMAEADRRTQAVAQESARLKGEYEAKMVNIAQEARTLRTDYEAKIDLMQRQLDALNANLNETTRRHNDNLNQLTETTRRYNENAAQQAELVRRFNDAVSQLNASKMEMDKARKEFAMMQEELRLATRKNDEIIAARDGDLLTIQRLADDTQLEEARARATAAAAAAAAAATAQMTVQAIPPPPNPAFVPGAAQSLELDPVIAVSSDAVVAQSRLAAYRTSSQDLVKASQGDQPTMVLVAMKSVVIACKTITEDVEAAEASPSVSDHERAVLANAKGLLSNALSGLMSVAKAHAAGTSWGPDALVSATNALTSAVNDLVRAAGNQRPEPELAQSAGPQYPAPSVSPQPPPSRSPQPAPSSYPPPTTDQTLAAPSGYSPPPATSAAPAAYEPPEVVERRPPSSTSARGPPPVQADVVPTPPSQYQEPSPAEPPAASGAEEIVELDELKIYLEKQTDQIVKAIQQLLYAMRQSTTYGQDFRDTVSGITNIVDELVDTTQSAFTQPSASHLRSQGEEILKSLRTSNDKLQELGDSIVNTPQTQAKSVKQKLASASYEVAKQVKELINLLPE